MSTEVPEDRRPIRRALISVYDKTGLEDLAQALSAAGVQLVSTGSTAARIAAAGVAVTKVEDLTGFPECLDGRVKTLHPKVHAGLLADVRLPTHVEQLTEMRVEPFDLLVSSLYPFTETVASGATPDECIEQIDIGGPSMIRGAAKNHANVAVVVDPARYGEVLEALAGGGFTLAAAPAPGGGGLRPHRVVRRGGGFVDGQRADRHQRRHRLPGVDRCHLGEGRGPALRREPAPAGGALPALAAAAWRRRNSCTARRCRTTTTSTRTPPGGPPTTSTGRPLPSSSMPTRVALPSATMWPRLTARRTSATRSRRTAG